MIDNPGPFSDAPDLPDWLASELPFRRRVFHDGPHAIHFIDHGEGPPVLLQHGNPTWCYLWRKVVPLLREGGLRVIVPDLVGLGLSDKPGDASLHTLPFHARQIAALTDALDLRDLVIVGQDWGGPILAMVAAMRPGLVRAAVFANTSLAAPRHAPRLSWFHRISRMPVVSDVFFRYLNLPVALMDMVQGDRRSIGGPQKRAYRFPLRRLADRVAPLALARMVPDRLDHPTMVSLSQVEHWAGNFRGPVRLVWGCRDPIMGPALRGMRRVLLEPPVVETEAGHFLQEEVPQALAAAVLAVVRQAADKR